MHELALLVVARQNLVYRYIEAFVLCPNCRLPESGVCVGSWTRAHDDDAERDALRDAAPSSVRLSGRAIVTAATP